jgi:hypothetical protein
MLAARLPEGLAQRLTTCRQRLRQMTSAVDDLNRGNIVLIRHCATFLHQLLVEITGGEAASTGYNKTGARPDPRCGSLIQARG